MEKDYKKISKTRRQRGYHWEDTIVKRFCSLDDWTAVRLGSPSTALPDVMAINDKIKTVFAIEAKSGTTNSLFVPYDQIKRCMNWVCRFGLYKTKKVILAFKFSQKKRIGRGEYEHRELREYFKVWNMNNPITNCICDYDGNFFASIDGKREKLQIDNLLIDFKNSKKEEK